jgi:hypothetical protein
MKSILSILFLCCFVAIANAQDAKKIIQKVNLKFAKVNDYKADVNLKFNIPNVKLGAIDAKVFFKKPGKFKMKAKGIFFLPKHNPLQNMMTTLQDVNSYQAIASGNEMVNGVNCIVINIIPIKAMGELVLGKFWIDEAKTLIMKSEITTKNNGTVLTENKYGKYAEFALPDEIIMNMDVNKFKIPKMLALDINKKKTVDANPGAKKQAASIVLKFTNFFINKTVEDKEFVGE